VTRHWAGNETKSADYAEPNQNPPKITKNEDYTLIQLPYLIEQNKLLERIAPLRRFVNLINTATGNFSPQEDANKAFYEYLNVYLKENPVDYLMVVSAPLNIIKLGHRLAAKFNVALIADFIDLWDNGLLSADYKPNWDKRLRNFFYELYLRRWLKNASLITSVSRGMTEQIELICPEAKTTVVMNGFEAEPKDSQLESSNSVNPKFTFSVMGTLYPQQDLSIMIEGLQLFLKDKNLAEIQLNFIGTAAFPQVQSFLEKNLPKECTSVTFRIPFEQAKQKTRESHVLFYAGWKGYKGLPSAKIYGYLGAGRNILIAPSDKDMLAEIISETEAGEITDSPAEFAQILNHWFQEWKTTGNLTYRGKPEKINYYSWENQAKLFAEEIKKINKTKAAQT
jgi:glycosyltransferase involved in cell wall biosynthesis